MAFDGRLASGVAVLAAVVDTGSFGRAAEVLDMTQSGVSRAVARLEKLLGVRVLERTTRSVTLTEEGRRLVEQLAPLMADMEEAAHKISATAASVSGRLRVHVDPFFSRLILAPQLGRFLERHLDLTLEIVTRDQLGDLVADGFDIAFRFGPPKSSTLVARKVFDTRILTVAAPAYLERYGRPLQPSELQSEHHICIQFRDPENGRLFDWEFHRDGKVLNVATAGPLTLNDVGTMHGICCAGYGIAQVMELGVEPLLKSKALVELFPDWNGERFPLYALYPSRKLLPARVGAFLDFVLELSR